jgi:hypothetical protein
VTITNETTDEEVVRVFRLGDEGGHYTDEQEQRVEGVVVAAFVIVTVPPGVLAYGPNPFTPNPASWLRVIHHEGNCHPLRGVSRETPAVRRVSVAPPFS